ncbi:MAG: hypothetical protein HOV82_17065 [Streptomyces sp.]|nr:hypothetical protein [Streptomyces sp.]NUP36198.1 hypothetical protein [Streptomyces sp.]NUS75545.1 hypothetical protein [Streptomyces sp.]
MAVWECAECTTKYAVGAPKCPHCESVVRVDERAQKPEEEESDMAKVTVHGGASDATAEGLEAGEDVSAGSSSSTSSETESSTPEKSDEPSPSRARTTGSRSKKEATDKASSARPTDGGPAAGTSAADDK